jgi:L,D-transpeptidase ErfK/SrfK
MTSLLISRGLLVAILASGPPTEPVPLTTQIAGGQFTYETQSGDTVAGLAARHGIEARRLRKVNQLGNTNALAAGVRLLLDNRHLVPPTDVPLVVSIAQRRLFHFENGALRASYPVAVGRPTWPTPRGAFAIVLKEENPVWDVPRSIQEEMRRTGKPVRTKVRPGPDNPLGRFWLGLSLGSVGIHGTIAPNSIYQYATHGCIRLHPDDIADLFPHVDVDTPGVVVYEPVLLGYVDGRVYLEAHADPYRRESDALTRVRVTAAQHGLAEAIDWERVSHALKVRDGQLRDVTAP